MDYKKNQTLAGLLDNISRVKGENYRDSDIYKAIGISKDQFYDIKGQQLNQIPADVAIKLSIFFGVELEVIFGIKSLEGDRSEYFDVFSDFSRVTEFRDNVYSLASKLSIDESAQLDIKRLARKVTQKPKIVFVGQSNAGKSTIINYLLNKQVLKKNWLATTSAKTYILHTEDKPSFLRENAVVFKRENIELSNLHDESYFNANKYIVGNEKTIEDYSTHQGNAELDFPICSVFYCDSDILKNCVLVDAPGIATEHYKNTDDKIALNAKNEADILVYLSMSTQFLHSTDIEYLKNCLKCLRPFENKKDESNPFKPLSNLYILASQAHHNMGVEEFDEMLDQGAEFLYESLPEAYLSGMQEQTGYEYTAQMFNDRVFPFTTNADNKEFGEDFVELLSKLPDASYHNAKKIVTDYLKGLCSDIDNELKAISQMKSDATDAIKKKERDLKTKQSKIRRGILNLKDSACNKFSESYNSIIDVDHIVEIIKDNDIKRKKRDYERLTAIIQAELEASLEKILTDESTSISTQIDDFLDEFEFKSNTNSSVDSARINGIINARNVFASSLAGVAAYGGLALWASTCGNLGGYILVAKGVSLLSGLGISLGGTAAVASAVAAIGGPVVIGVVIAIVTGLSAMTLFRNAGYEKTLAKKVCKAYNDESNGTTIKGCFFNVVNQFFEDTANAFDVASNKTISQWYKESMEINRKFVSGELEDKKAQLEAKQAQLESILKDIC